MSGVRSLAADIAADRVEAVLEEMLRTVGRHEDLIYSGRGVTAADALAFLRRAGALVEACLGISSHDSVADVIDELDEAFPFATLDRIAAGGEEK